MQDHEIAKVVHEANAAFCLTQGDASHNRWEFTPFEIQDSIIAGVSAIRNYQVTTPEGSHNSWLEFKQAHGWTRGDIKDLVAKTHPNMVPFHELSLQEQMKDRLFVNIVMTLLGRF